MLDWRYKKVSSWYRQDLVKLVLHIDDNKIIECRFVDFGIRFVFHGYRIKFASYGFDLKDLCYVKNIGVFQDVLGEDEPFVILPSNPREKYVLSVGL